MISVRPLCSIASGVLHELRSSRAERQPHLHLHAEIFFPDQFSVEVVSKQAARAEGRINISAVGNGRVRGETAVRAMIAFMRRRLFCGALPEDFAGLAIETEHFEP